jgi:ribosome-binding ATPase
LKIGLVGLPNSGKTTIFNLLTHQTLPTGPYFTQSTEMHLGVARVHDDRLDVLMGEFPKAAKKYAEITFVDTAGFMSGDSGKPGGSDAQFLAALRDVEAVAYVICAFHNPEVLQVHTTVDPVRDIKKLELEMIFNDLDVTDKKIQRINKELQAQKEKNTPEKEVLMRCKKCLEEEKALRTLSFTTEEEKLLGGFRFLSQKPAMVLLNTDEKDIGNPVPKDVDEYCRNNSFPVVALSGKIEEEISECPEEEQTELLAGLGITEPALTKFVHAAYSLLDLMSFLTAGDKEVRAWSIRRGTTAWEAAGKVHTDIQRGFIRAEVTAYDDFIREGSMRAAKEKHFMRLEGKDYVLKNGDIVLFRFSV